MAAWESGEKYIKRQEEHRKEIAAKNRWIKQLEKEVALAHAKTIHVRNKWFNHMCNPRTCGLRGVRKKGTKG